MKLIKGEKTQTQIVDVAAKLFIENGFAATTTRQITDALGMTRGILYNYFTGKDEIFEAVIKQYHPWLQIVPAIESADGDSITDFVNNAGHLLISRWNENPEYTRLHFIELVEFKGEHLPGLFDSVFNQMVEVLTQKFKGKKGFEHLSVATISRSLLGLFFTYLMTEEFTGMPSANTQNKKPGLGLSGNQFDYFTDIYLQGVLTNLSDEKKKK